MRKFPLFVRILCSLVIATYLCTEARAKVWHVTKKDLPSIAPEDQMRSIGEAVSRIQAGDTVIIHGGIYRERVVLEKSGTATEPITVRAATGEHVVVTGADRMTQLQRAAGEDHIFSTDWPHRFIQWNESFTHPNDDYHRLIGRCEQVFVNDYQLRQVLERDKLSRGTFYVDLDEKRLYIWHYNNADISGDKAMVEASVRDSIWTCKGQNVRLKGIRFRYAANRAQHGAVQILGDDNTVEDCMFEYTNSCGVNFGGERITVRNCTFQHNGQLGFAASRAHKLLMTGCVVRNNNTKGFNRGWEAGGNKIVLTRGAVIENCTFTENRGNGIWFDIGNEDNEVRKCLVAFNENAGIFYEISYGLHAHDNVIVGNGFAFTPSAWGASSGISISSSPACIIERNLLIGNKEGFNFREQTRSTPRIDSRKSEPVWNHDHTIRNNVLAYNRDAQLWGWFDINDERHWPKPVQRASQVNSATSKAPPAGSSLQELNLRLENNLYWTAPGQGLFNWGVTWKRHKRYQTLEDMRTELGLGQSSRLAEISFKDFPRLDLRVPRDSPAVTMQCYPRGDIPGVALGMYEE
ncbi:MAG: right-handed parallel beta-helix repeat-containing protein [Phycisphaerales bacterium]|nr:MAG: right-handed parallel beta-helix repeat-containing protein [Phycisphaerales bacterium]